MRAPRPNERYTIRRKVLRFLGGAFHIYASDGSLVGYCDQKRLRLKEDLRVYTDESKSEELLHISTQQVIDFGATYTVALPEGGVIGSFRRKGLKSMLRDEWLILDEHSETIASVREDSQFTALVRRFIDAASLILPQRYDVRNDAGEPIASYRTHFNPFVHRLGVAVLQEDDRLDDLLLLAGGVLLLAIEGRQD